MGLMTVWTKQHKNILRTLQESGRHIVEKAFLEEKYGDMTPYMAELYGWYVQKAAAIVAKPDDVFYPVWVSLDHQSALKNDPDTVVLELLIDDSQVIKVDYDKWGAIVNYMYVPESAEDDQAHQELLASYGIDDSQAYMSNFYPMVKKKIIKSWERLFEPGEGSSDVQMGTIWEIQKDWIRNITGPDGTVCETL